MTNDYWSDNKSATGDSYAKDSWGQKGDSADKWSKGSWTNDKWNQGNRSNDQWSSGNWSGDKWSKDKWSNADDGGSWGTQRNSWANNWGSKAESSYTDRGYSNSQRDGKSNWSSSSYKNNQGWSSNKGSDMKLWPVDFSAVQLVDFVKDFYVPTRSVMERSEEECEDIRQANGIKIISGDNVPKVIVSFEEASFPEYLVRSLYRHFGPDARPTPIQMQGWSVAMSGRSLIGIAQTGSGKTLAYILPAIVHINAQPPSQAGEGPIALVLVPTRELCTQIAEEAEKFSKSIADVGGVPVRIACAFGGVKKSEQLWAIRESLDILVAAPGRLIDFLASGQTSLQRTTYLVLDEADECLNMGFEPQLRQILSQIRPDRQTLMWSATWPKEVRSLAQRLFVEAPVHIQIGTDDLAANHQIEQVITYVSHEKAKMDMLFQEVLPQLYLDQDGNRLKEDAKLLVFCNTKDNVDYLTARMRTEGVPAVAIHSGKEQSERLWVFEQFRHGDTKVLVSTNLMGRGVDVPKVNMVLNYDMPKNIAEYIHRIGRTGRAGALGKSISFFSPADAPIVHDLIGIMNEASQNVPEWLQEFKSNPYYRPAV